MSSTARQRLEREARALAKLSHPNVVQVYDAGVHDGRVFLAMELVEGQTLKDWCRQKPRPSWREILACYLEAARGLAAAHRKGLVHRDIKPSNLLIGQHGRVRVADFGLAAASLSGLRDPKYDLTVSSDSSLVDRLASEDSQSSLNALSRGSSSLQARLEERCTQFGAIMGTLPYMAPEQHLEAAVGPAADQYSFCVSLYQGLHGQLPFARPKRKRDSIHWMVQKHMAHFVAPTNLDVPGWVHDVLARGMAPEPADRYPSMDALIAALEDDPARRRKSRVRLAAFVAVSSIAAAALVVLGWTQLRDDHGTVCQDLDLGLDEAWNQTLQGQIRKAFAATKLPYAADTFERVSAILDDYAGEWTDMRIETCKAAQAAGNSPADAMYLGVGCLKRRREQFAALTELFATQADEPLVRKAVQAARALPRIDDCTDVDGVNITVPMPEEPSMRARVVALQTRINRLEVALEAGKVQQGVEQGQTLMVEIRALDYPPLQARAMYVVAQLKEEVGDYAGAAALLTEAIPMAAEARDDVLAVYIRSKLVHVMGVHQHRTEQALAWAVWLQADARRAGDDLVMAQSLSDVGGVLEMAGKDREAEVKHRQALALREKVLGPDHPDVATSLYNLSIPLKKMGQHELAISNLQRSLAILEKLWGPDHPDVASSVNNLAGVLFEMGKYQEAQTHYERALAIYEKVLGSDHVYVALTLTALGRTFIRSNALDAAQRCLDRSLAVWGNDPRTEHPEYVGVWLGLGELAQARNDFELASTLYGRALGRDIKDRYPEIQLLLAEVLWAASTERERAIAQAREAREHYLQTGNQALFDRASRWLAKRGIKQGR